MRVGVALGFTENCTANSGGEVALARIRRIVRRVRPVLLMAISLVRVVGRRWWSHRQVDSLQSRSE